MQIPNPPLAQRCRARRCPGWQGGGVVDDQSVGVQRRLQVSDGRVDGIVIQQDQVHPVSTSDRLRRRGGGRRAQGDQRHGLRGRPVPDHDLTAAARQQAFGEAAAQLLSIQNVATGAEATLVRFIDCYLKALQVSGVSFGEVARSNLTKTRGRFVSPKFSELSLFDDDFEEEEQLPYEFEIEISQRESGLSYLRYNGVFIGDPLTDNIIDEDGYRFHDVFHFAHAAILHWSPVMRSLIKQKRKSDKVTDQAQDGGRAIVVEEGLTAWIFSRAKELDFFVSNQTVSFDMLKTIADFVRGYEVDQCPLSLWEQAIIQGYAVFREVKANNGGVVIGNRNTRTIGYRPL
jgi:hypothetical protein